MPNNSSDQIRKKLYEEYEDSLFKLVMHDAAQKEGKRFLAEKKNLKSDPNSYPSQEAMQKFSQELEDHLKKPRAYAAKGRLLRVFNRTAVALLIAIVVLFTTVVSVQALRVRVLNFFMDIHPKYTSFQLKENDNSTGGQIPVVNWTKAYVPTYIPDGYIVSNSTNSNGLKQIIFENQQDKNLRILYMEFNEASGPAVDTENTSALKPISINGHEGTLVVKDSVVTVVWQIEDSLFTVQAPTGEEIAIRIAEGVKYME